MLFIKEDNLSTFNLNLMSHPSYLISKEQERPLRYMVINTGRKPSWNLVLVAGSKIVWWRAFTLSESAGVYYDEIYFINSGIKSSFSYKAFNKYIKLPSGIINKTFNLPLECAKPPRFYFQPNNKKYDYLKKFPYLSSQRDLNLINNQIINIYKGNLGAYFSNEIFCIANFYKNAWFSQRKRIFMFQIQQYTKKNWAFRYCNIKKKKKSLRYLKKRYRLLKKGIFNNLKKKLLVSFYSKINKLKKRVVIKKPVFRFKKKFSIKRYFSRRVRKIFSGGGRFKKERCMRRRRAIKVQTKKSLARVLIANKNTFLFRALISALRRSKKFRFKKKTNRFLKKRVI